MAGPLSSERPVAEATLTGGPDTSVSSEMAKDFKQVLRTKHMERPVRTGTFAVNTDSPMSRQVNQKSTGMLTRLQGKEKVKKRRFRK